MAFSALQVSAEKKKALAAGSTNESDRQGKLLLDVSKPHTQQFVPFVPQLFLIWVLGLQSEDLTGMTVNVSKRVRTYVRRRLEIQWVLGLESSVVASYTKLCDHLHRSIVHQMNLKV